MPEINPYESPQSEPLPGTGEESAEEQFPPWLGRVLGLQLLVILLTLFSPFGWLPKVLQLAIFLLHEAFAAAMLLAALRYRLGWLLVLELIVIGLPLMMWFTVELKR